MDHLLLAQMMINIMFAASKNMRLDAVHAQTGRAFSRAGEENQCARGKEIKRSQRIKLFMNKILLLIALVSLTFFTKNSFGQAATVELPKILLPSPDAAALGKFGDIPVGYQTGIPNISIPLYEVKSKKLSIPISLSYHSGGFRVNEIASSTGLGWTLSAGGSISRVIKSFPDESDGGILRKGLTTYNDVLQNKDYLWLQSTQYCRDGWDIESDEYNFTLPSGVSGKFIFDANKNPFLIPYKPLKVEFDLNLSTFKITDENGIIYKFAATEKAGTVACSGEVIDNITAWHLTEMISPDGDEHFTIEYQDMSSYVENSGNYSVEFGNKWLSPTNFQYSYHQTQSSNTETWYRPKVIKKINFDQGMVEFLFSDGRKDIVQNGSGLTTGPVLNQITINSLDPGSTSTYTKLKSYAFEYDYFNSTTPDDTNPLAFRLQLKSVKMNNSQDALIGKYAMVYNNIGLPVRNSRDRDMWGFYNGYKNNPTLVRKTEALDNWGSVIQIGDADRDPSGDYIRTCILKQLYYPTGGFTEFEFEPHKINYIYTQALNSQRITLGNANAIGSGTPSQNVVYNSFTPSANLHTRLTSYISKYGYEGVSQIPKVSLVDLTDNITIYSASGYLTQDNTYVNDHLDLKVNHNYQLKTEAYQSDKVYAQTFVDYRPIDQDYSLPNIVEAAGVRVASIKNHDSDGTLLNTEEFKYGQIENGVGTLLIPDNLGQFNYSLKDYELVYPIAPGNNPPNNNCFSLFYTLRIYPGSPIHDFVNFGGSTVLYDQVTKYNGSKAANNGKTIYYYDLYKSASQLVSTYYNLGGLLPTNRNWQNGYLKREEDYKNDEGIFKIVKSKDDIYSYEEQTSFGLLVGEKRKRISYSSCDLLINDQTEKDRYYWSQFQIYGGKVLLTNTISTTYDNNEHPAYIEGSSFTYENPVHSLPTKIQSSTSRGYTITTEKKYPLDASLIGDAENARVELNNRHQYSVLLFETTTNNETNSIVSQKVNNYKLQSNGAPLLDNIQAKVGINPLETRAQIYSYDERNNITEQSLTNNVRKSYIWGYNGAYPIAEVINGSIGTEVPVNTIAQTPALQNYNQLGIAKSTALVQIGTFTLGVTESTVDTNYGITHNQQNDSAVPTYLRIVELIFREAGTLTDMTVNLPASRKM